MSVNRKATNPIQTVLIITVGMLFIHLLSKWDWALYIALIVGVMGIASGFLARKIDDLWMRLTWLLSLIVPNVLLSLVFYVLLTPVALLSRVFGERNQLSLKNSGDSLFKNCDKEFDKDSLENPW